MAPQKKYICAFCARAFSRSEHKQRHERSHTKEKPFHCDYCASAFVRRDLLQRHCRTVHNVNVVPNPTKTLKKNIVITSPDSPIDFDEHSVQTSLPGLVQPQQQQQPQQHVTNHEVANEDSSENKTSCLTFNSGSTKSEENEMKIVQSLSLSKKLSTVLSNFEKITILQSKSESKINFIFENLNINLPLSLDLSKDIDDYFLMWNIKKSTYPLLDSVETEVFEFINSFTNSSSLNIISKYYSKFNGQNFNLTNSDSQKILAIECNMCLLYSVLAIGASNFNNDNDSVILFMKAWNLLISNLIPRLNSNTENFDSKPPINKEILNDQMMILKNLFMLAYVCSQINSKIKYSSVTSNVVNEDIVFNYLDEISYIIMSHIEETSGGYQLTHNSQSRSSSTSSLDSSESYTSVNESTTIDENLPLFWSIYIILSKFFMVRNHAPPKIYSFLLNKPLIKGPVLSKILKNLATRAVQSFSKFNNEIIVSSLSNELLSHIHYNKMLIYKSKSILHNSLIFSNKSFNNGVDLDNYVYKMFQKKILINSPAKFQSLLNSYMFNPTESYNWDLLYLSIKEFNMENIDIDDKSEEKHDISTKFKFNDFFKVFFEDFEGHNNLEVDAKEQYLQFIKYLIPFFSKNKVTDLDYGHICIDDLNKNSFINNNLGIATLPIIFKFQCLQVASHDEFNFNTFDRKRIHYLLMEWYLTIIKLIIGLKNDTSVYHKESSHQNFKGYSKTSSNESAQNIHDLNMNYTLNSSNYAKKYGSNEYELTNNYIFQCLMYIIKQVSINVKLPNGKIINHQNFSEKLDFENDLFHIDDEIIYYILKNIEHILDRWLVNLNQNGEIILESIGFKFMRKFMEDYIYSQLNFSKHIIESNQTNDFVYQNQHGQFSCNLNMDKPSTKPIYSIKHRNSINIASLDSNYILHGSLQHYKNEAYSFNSQQNLSLQTNFQAVQPQSNQTNLPHQQLRSQETQQQQHYQITSTQPLQLSQSQTSLPHISLTQGSKDLVLPPILPPLSNTDLQQRYPISKSFSQSRSR